MENFEKHFFRLKTLCVLSHLLSHSYFLVYGIWIFFFLFREREQFQ